MFFRQQQTEIIISFYLKTQFALKSNFLFLLQHYSYKLLSFPRKTSFFNSFHVCSNKTEKRFFRKDIENRSFSRSIKNNIGIKTKGGKREKLFIIKKSQENNALDREKQLKSPRRKKAAEFESFRLPFLLPFPRHQLIFMSKKETFFHSHIWFSYHTSYLLFLSLQSKWQRQKTTVNSVCRGKKWEWGSIAF